MVSYGLVGLLRPLTVYPSEMVYWSVRDDEFCTCCGLTTVPYRTCLRFPFFKVRYHLKQATINNDSCHVALHFDTAANHKRVRLFWTAFTGMFVYEVLPAYIFPLLNGFSIFCLTSQHASSRTRDVFTNLFGGANANEGLGFLSLSFDWQYLGSM
jgi:hypothetical protein